jgi:hypothetical protein
MTVAGSNEILDDALDFSVVGGIVGLLLAGGIICRYRFPLLPAVTSDTEIKKE